MKGALLIHYFPVCPYPLHPVFRTSPSFLSQGDAQILQRVIELERTVEQLNKQCSRFNRRLNRIERRLGLGGSAPIYYNPEL
ncbi:MULTISPECIES: hypothetical protein [Bacillaceae]|uniref:Uncharacterized protein n=2 Tax=Bacillus infantis TaxID=324767 RepID=U5LDH6_9BACI|nr:MULTISPECIES: hypothetical protein [Bacillus]AGX05894.1 hypothetical protein N288_20105 [Bacillus infantis NRRL B-14911]MCA1037847.1 hypothetical protein [Bacillus infantis]MCK6205174.1 hypothetical protein [Bacillus infantis]MCP1160154.1 hypothetical protein [Bacillus infantis]MDW2875984.1 hypothetical protein [Bacillus infantis]